MDSADVGFMRRCFDLARAAVERDELPFGSVIARGAEEISAEANSVRASADVTRHAEVCAIVAAQRRFGRPSLERLHALHQCRALRVLPYAIRELRIARVVFALGSPVMGGASRWDVLQDHGLAGAMPEVFSPAPEVVAGFLADKADALLRRRRR